MDLVIREADGQAMVDAQGLDGPFLVESELALFAEGGVIRYEVVPVPPYKKSYAGEDSSVGGGVSGKAVFLAHLDGSVAGRVVLSEGWNGYAWVEHIAVDTRRRRAGVGRALIDRAVAWAVERGLPGIRAETQSNNVAACKIYEACRFRLGGFDRDLYRGLDGGTTEAALFWYLYIRGSPVRPRTGGSSAWVWTTWAGRRGRATRSAPSTFASSLGGHGVGASTLVRPLVEAPSTLVGEAMPQGLGQAVRPILLIPGDRGEIALQPGPEALEACHAQGLVDRAGDLHGITLQVLVPDLAEPPLGDQAPLPEAGVVHLRVERVMNSSRRAGLLFAA